MSPVKIEFQPVEIIEVVVDSPPAQEEVSLEVCNGVISSELFVNSISKDMFQNNLPSEVQQGLRSGLLSMVGRTPP
jgi:hypothetical protein